MKLSIFLHYKKYYSDVRPWEKNDLSIITKIIKLRIEFIKILLMKIDADIEIPLYLNNLLSLMATNKV